MFPNADWSLESAVTKPGEDGCVIVETRLYLGFVGGSGDRILMAISRDKICPAEIRTNSVEIGKCVDGYYSNVYIENFKSDDLECLTVLLENEEVRKLYDQHLEDIKSTL